ncbi:MAG TPA: c-type cytochrome, partial [Verrucomicrobiae bacterium]
AVGALVVAASVAIIAGCASTGRLGREQAGYPKEQVNARGLYLESCERCHGQDGRSRTLLGRLVRAQDFTDSKWKMETSNAEVIHSIQKGPKSKIMPMYGPKFSEAEIEALAAYVQSFPPKP